MKLRRFKKRTINKRGQAVVEIAIMLPFLLLIILSTIELGVFFSDYMQLNNAVQYASDIGKVRGTTNSEIVDQLNKQFEGANTNNLTVTIKPDNINNRPNGGWIFVKAEYNYRFITPIVSSVFGNPYPMTAYSTRRIE